MPHRRQMAADGGYASLDNLCKPKEPAGCCKDVAFFTKSAASRSKAWSRAVGSIASCETSAPASRPTSPASQTRIRRSARCTWRGLAHFKAYIWSAVVADNLVLFARLKPA